jgi:peptidoglycan/xylan/chitin deacetylase (PgdA/CDA1 family)
MKKGDIVALLSANNKFPILLTFDVDGETLWISRDTENMKRPVVLSQGEYGPLYAVPRILTLLNNYNIKSTFFIPGWIMEKYPSMLQKVIDDGHEVAHHGYMHEWPDSMPADEELAAFEKAINVFKQYTSTYPQGYRSPAWEFSPNTLQMLIDHGFLFSSNMMNSEEPYEYMSEGAPTGLVELPVSWILDDAPFFLHSLTTPGRMISQPNPIGQMWEQELRTLYEDKYAKCFVLTLHPQVIGRPSRLEILKGLIDMALGLPSVWFTTCGELASLVKSENRRKEGCYREILPITSDGLNE